MISTQVAIQPIPYLHFGGNCAEVIEFYSKALNAKLTSKTTFGDMPVCPDGGQNPMATEDPSKIVNAQLELPGGGQLYLGDCPSFIPFQKSNGAISLTLNYPTIEEGEKAFRALTEGGNITMDWSPTFWAEMFGCVDDKFGISWIVNGNLK
jgi:PhnB protein